MSFVFTLTNDIFYRHIRRHLMRMFDVFFSCTIDKINCNICDQILEGLELIDDECDVFGIHMVKIQDPQLAKRYSIKTFPALVYFRNGNPLLFEGDMQNEQSVLEWLIDDDNRELADEIEEVRIVAKKFFDGLESRVKRRNCLKLRSFSGQ